MKWWVFNEEQLIAALNSWHERVARENDDATFTVDPASTKGAVCNFLDSPEALQHKLRGDK